MYCQREAITDIMKYAGVCCCCGGLMAQVPGLVNHADQPLMLNLNKIIVDTVSCCPTSNLLRSPTEESMKLLSKKFLSFN
jgi:hypothetical protein